MKSVLPAVFITFFLTIAVYGQRISLDVGVNAGVPLAKGVQDEAIRPSFGAVQTNVERPQFVLGLRGMPRRYVSYPAGVGFDTPNLVSTIGYFVMFVGVILFLADVWISLRRRVPAGDSCDFPGSAHIRQISIQPRKTAVLCRRRLHRL